jgi:hypothetical protein
MKVLFLNTGRRPIDCDKLLGLGSKPDVIILAELTQGSQIAYEKGLDARGYKHMSRPNCSLGLMTPNEFAEKPVGRRAHL